jgi:hypothetical protein
METDIFRAGVRPGAPSTEIEIKMMLCYLLSNLGQPISFDQLYGALNEHEMVNYFQLWFVLGKLQGTGHISLEQDGEPPARYTATALGEQAGKEFEKNVPLAVREKSLEACRRLLARERRLGEVKTSQTPCESGFILELTIPEGEGELLSVRVFAPTEKECERLKRRFLNAPLTVYKGMLALLTGDERLLGEIFTKVKPIF